MNACWMLERPAKPFVGILLGRNGDLIQMLPAWKAIYDRTGLKPIIMVSTEYAGVLEGVSYVEPYPLALTWWEGVPLARHLADGLFGGSTIMQGWHDPNELGKPSEGATVLQSHGKEWGVDMSLAPDYGTSMWQRCGFTRADMLRLPLVFDRRDATRERLLAQRVRKQPGKPLLLVNLTGNSSPFACLPEVMRTLAQFARRVELVDLGKIRAHRIYDLLGLYDQSVGLITSDTSTAHLAPASRVPWVAYTVDSWSTSVPKGNVMGEFKYSQALESLDKLASIVEGWITAYGNQPAKSDSRLHGLHAV